MQLNAKETKLGHHLDEDDSKDEPYIPKAAETGPFSYAMAWLDAGHFVKRVAWASCYSLRQVRQAGVPTLVVYSGNEPVKNEITLADLNAIDWLKVENPDTKMKQLVGEHLFVGNYNHGWARFFEWLDKAGYKMVAK